MQSRTARWLLTGIFVVLAVAVFSRGGVFGAPSPEVPYTAFERLVAAGHVQSVVIRGHEVFATLAEPQPVGPGGRKASSATTRVPEIGRSDLLEKLSDAGVTVTAREQRQYGRLV